MQLTIKNVLEKFDDYKIDKYGKWKIGRVEAKQFLQDNLTLMLESIEKNLPGNRELGQSELLEDTCLESFKAGYNQYRQEVINIINSHK